MPIALYWHVYKNDKGGMMPRKKNFERILNAVLIVLEAYPLGITLRELSRKAGLPVSTLRWYLDRDLKFYVRDQAIGPSSKPFARLITLQRNATKPATRKLGKVLKEYGN